MRADSDLLVNLKNSADDKIEASCNEETAAEKALMEKGKGNQDELTLVMIDLLPKKLLGKVVYEIGLDRSKVATLKTDKLLVNLGREGGRRKALKRVQCERVKKEHHAIYKKNHPIGDDRVVSIPRTAAAMIAPQTFSAGTLPPALRPPCATQTTPTNSTDTSKKVDYLLSHFSSLVMSPRQAENMIEGLPNIVRAVVTAANAPSHGPQSGDYQQQYPPNIPCLPQQGQNQSRFLTQPQMNTAYGEQQSNTYGYIANQPDNCGYNNVSSFNNAGAPPATRYNYCGSLEHTRYLCNSSELDMDGGWVHEIEGRVHLGRHGQGGPQIDPRGCYEHGL